MTPMSVLSVSQTFFRGFELCHGNGLPFDAGRPNAIIPSVVCLAFSVELALKAILLGTGDSARGHALDTLFSKLPPEIQTEIIQLTGIATSSFPEQLALAARAFVEWRYIYEQNGLHTVNTPFLLALREATAKVANRFVELQRQALKASTHGTNE
jgi:HEPN domain-containing protein